MSMSCRTCTDPECEYRGEDRGACEDHDAEPHEEPSIIELEWGANRKVLKQLRSEVDELAAQAKQLRREWDDFFAALVRVRDGE